MVTPSVVLIDRSRGPVGMPRLAEVARALQTQMDRDLAGVWGVSARILVASGGAAPAGAWPISILDRPRARPGVHRGAGGEPYAEVVAGDRWTIAASHVLMEMIVDPAGERFVDGPPPGPPSELQPVRYLVEVCDPCAVVAYEIDGVEVSDFVTPDYYGLLRTRGTAFDFLRRLRGPLEVPAGCSLAWLDPGDGHWHQRGPDRVFSRSTAGADASRSPREDRDLAFQAEVSRHDLATVMARYAARPHRARPARQPGPA